MSVLKEQIFLSKNKFIGFIVLTYIKTVFAESEMDSLRQDTLLKMDTDALERLCKQHGLTKKAGETKESIRNKII